MCSPGCAPACTMCVQRVLGPVQIDLEMGSRYTLRYVVRLGCLVYVPRCGCLISYVVDSYWSSSRHQLCVRFAVCHGCAPLYLGASYYVYRYAVLLRTCRNICTGKLWYPLHSTWVSRVGVPLLRGTCLCARLPCATAVLPCA